MSGLGFENGGLSIAHSMTRGLVKARGARDAIHGDQVAYGLLVQLALRTVPTLFCAIFSGSIARSDCRSRLAGLGMAHATDDEVIELARLTMTAPHLANVRPAATQDGVVEAIHRVQRLANP